MLIAAFLTGVMVGLVLNGFVLPWVVDHWVVVIRRMQRRRVK